MNSATPDNSGFSAPSCADVSTSDPRVWDLACVYEDRGFGPEEWAQARALGRMDRVLLKEEMDRTDARQRAASIAEIAFGEGNLSFC